MKVLSFLPLVCRRAIYERFLKDLTVREREVLSYMIAGWMYKDIALELGISVSNVCSVASRSLRVLGVVSRNELNFKILSYVCRFYDDG